MSGANRGRLTNNELFWTQDANVSVQVRMTPSFTAGNTEATLTMFSTDSTSNLVRIASVKDPVLAQDAATKNYVDGLIAGATSWKDTVRVATTTAGVLASDFENGDTIDGITLATGDRILIKNQANAIQNGIYTVNATGAPTRAADLDTGDSAAGAATYVQEGTANAEQVYICTTTIAAGDVVGTNSLTFQNLGSVIDVSAAGANTQVQFNNGGVLGANAAFTWDYSSNTLALTTDDSEMTFGAGTDMTLGSDGTNGTLATTANLALTTAGLSTTIGGAGTQVSWTGGDAANGTDLALIAGNSTTATNDGGIIVINGGDGNTTGAGGSVSITGGDGGATDASVGGTVTITGGSSTATNGDGGDVVITGGAATGTGTTGDVFLGSSGANANVRVFYNIAQSDITQPTQIVNKKYVDSVATGLSWKEPVVVATTTTLAGVYAGGAETITDSTAGSTLTIDGVSITTLGQRVLVKNGVTATPGVNVIPNGIYELTTIGVPATTPWVLTRTSDFNIAAGDQSGSAVFVQQGTVNADRAYVQVSDPGVPNTNTLEFVQFAGSGASVAGADTQIQYNNSGAFGAIDSFTFNKSNATPIFSVGNDGASTGVTTNLGTGSAVTTSDVNIGAGTATNTSGTINLADGTGTATIDAQGTGLFTIQGAGAVDVRGAAASTFDLATVTTTGTIQLGPASTGAIEIGNASDSCLVSFNSTLDATAPGTAGVTMDGGLGVAENVYSSANFGFWSGTGTTAVNLVHDGTDSLLDSKAGDLRLEVTDTTALSHIRMNTSDQTLTTTQVNSNFTTGNLLNIEAQTITLSDAGTAANAASIVLSAPVYAKPNTGTATITDAAVLYVETPDDTSANVTITNKWSIWAEGDIRANAFEATSDVKFKENIEPIQLDNSPLQKLMEIEGYQYDWKPEFSSNRKKQWGVLAQQLESVGLEHVVSGTDRKSVNYLALIPLLIEAVKELASATVEFQDE